MKIEIPAHIKTIRFDIGLSYCAPNSAYWLNENNKDLYVIAVEPNASCVEGIQKSGIYCNPHNIQPFKSDNFYLMHCALDNVQEAEMKPFYNMSGDVGTSSLLKPTNSLHYTVDSVTDVLTVSLKSILDQIPWDRFEYIELVKIDTQGKDLDILKSAESYLERIAFITCEVNTFDHYENNPKPFEFHEYLSKAGFIKVQENSRVNNEAVDITFVNQKYQHLLNTVNYYTL